MLLSAVIYETDLNHLWHNLFNQFVCQAENEKNNVPVQTDLHTNNEEHCM